MSAKVSLADKLSQITQYWAPQTVAQMNDYDIMVLKVKGEVAWHTHEDTDDFFMVLYGQLEVQMRDQTVILGPGDVYVVKKGVEHSTVAREETHLLLLEPPGKRGGNWFVAAPPNGH